MNIPLPKPGAVALLSAMAWLLPAAGLAAAQDEAQDPQEITATVSLWSDRTELAVDMDFRAGLKLAGVAAAQPADVSDAGWFAQNRAALLEGGRGFCRIQSGTNWLPVQAADVSPGVEDRMELRVEYPPAPGRPLRFDLAGLKTLAGRDRCGVALTVLDRVNQKVLAQAVVFADAPSLVAEVSAPKPAPDFPPAPAAISAQVTPVFSNGTARVEPAETMAAPRRATWPFVLGAGVLLLVMLALRRPK